MPGRRESGRWWEIVYHRFLRKWGFSQGVWDMCSFYLIRNGALLIIIITSTTRAAYAPTGG